MPYQGDYSFSSSHCIPVITGQGKAECEMKKPFESQWTAKHGKRLNERSDFGTRQTAPMHDYT